MLSMLACTFLSCPSPRYYCCLSLCVTVTILLLLALFSRIDWFSFMAVTRAIGDPDEVVGES